MDEDRDRQDPTEDDLMGKADEEDVEEFEEIDEAEDDEEELES